MAERTAATPFQALAAEYPSSDSDVLLPGDLHDGSSDSVAADATFRCVLDHRAAADAALDDLYVTARLSQLGIVGPAAISWLSSTSAPAIPWV